MFSGAKWWLAWRSRQIREFFVWRLAYLLPRSVVSIAYVRVVAHATTGQYRETVVPELPAMEALRRWDNGEG